MRVLWLAMALAAWPVSAKPFEVAAWIDHFDFSGVTTTDGVPIDSETPGGWAMILDHVAETGATTMLWRNCGGANLRYASREDSHHHDSLIDPRRGPANNGHSGWVRYGETSEDILRGVARLCRERGLRFGVHWPYEENHWSLWCIGGWNLEHPQYWCRNRDGRPWWGRSSVAYDEVFQHKMRLVDELVDRGLEVLYIDTWRSGGWSPTDEYVPPVIERFRQQYGEDPPGDATDLRWCREVAKDVTKFIRGVRQHLDASGRKIELHVGLSNLAPDFDSPLVQRGADWQAWVDDGLVDGIVMLDVAWDAKDPFESTRALGRSVIRRVGGKCKVFWPVQQYDFTHRGIPSYLKASGLSAAEVTAKLTRIAWEEGAAGISLECVDYNNYQPDQRQTMRELVAGECHEVQPAPE